MTQLSTTEMAIHAGGGVAARALIVGPGQERWLDLHRKVDPDEHDRALVTVLCATGGSVGDAAAHLNVRPEYLARFVKRGRVRRLLAMRGICPRVEATPSPALPAYRAPTDAASVRALVVYRNPRPGRWRGAWRVEGLLADPSTRPAAVAAIARVVAATDTATGAALALGVCRETLRKWRRAWPELADVIDRVRSWKLVSLRRRPLTLDQAVDYLSPFLPATSGLLALALRRAGATGALPYPVRATPRQLARYVGRVDSRGRILVRTVVHRSESSERNTFEWSIVQTGEGE